jgi:hypothetical protein
MYNGNKNNKAEAKNECGQEYKDCKEDKMNNHNVTDLFRKYVHDVRNMKRLDKEMINNIRNMSNEEKMEIIIAFNDVVENINILLEL